MDRLRLPYRLILTEQGFTIVYSHISKLNLEAPTGPPVLRGQAEYQTQGQRGGGSARWVEKEDVLAMRWAWVDQGTGRPIGGPRRAFGVYGRQGSAPHQELMESASNGSRDQGRRPDQVFALFSF